MKDTMHPLQIALSRALTLAEKKPKNAGPNSGKGNGKGNGVADKADTATNSTPDAGGDDGGLIGTLGNLIWDHKWLIPVLFLAACIGINYLWKQYRNKQSMRGVAVRPLGPILSDITKFARVEDKRPLHPKLPDKITATRVYGTLTLLIIISLLPKVPNLPLGPLVPGLILTLILGSRYSKVARARRSVLNQMFAVANSECRYPKGSELAPWNYVQIAGWVNFTQPGQTIINIPAAMQSEDIRTREKFERNFNGTVSEENAWTYKWESAKNRLVCEPAAFLPNMAPYPGPGDKWDEIPVGVQGDGSQAIMPLSVAPHALVCGPTGSGKATALSERVPTPTGWTTIGEIAIGDQVFDSNGNPATVTGLSPIVTDHKTYEVVFSDGSVVTADADHLWWTETRAVRESRWTERRKPRVRRRLLTDAAVSRLSAALGEATNVDEMTMRQMADLAGVTDTSPWLRDIASNIGPVGEIRPMVRYHYKGQVVESTQNVRRWDAGEVLGLLAAKPARRNWAWASWQTTFGNLAPSQRGVRVSATEFAEMLSVPRKDALALLRASKANFTTAPERVKQVVSEKHVDRPGDWTRTYNSRRFLTEVLAYGQRAAWDKRHLQARGAVRTTEEIRATLRTAHGHANHSVPVAHALMLPEAALPLAPYTFGVWLGDGTSWHGGFVGIDHEVARNVEADGYRLSERTDRAAAERHPLFRTWTILGAKPILRQMGLLKTAREQGHTKHIPIEYLRASREQRQALLAGLLDTDGTVGESGSVSITQVNERLVHDIRELALSLGYRATLREGRATIDGTDFGPAWTVSWTCKESPFRISRKSETHAERSTFHAERNAYRYIVDVREVAPVPMRCIMVDSADRLFLIGSTMIPTHNSVLQRMILFHVLSHADTWRIVAIDMKKVEMTWLRKYEQVLKVATDLEESVEVLRSLRAEMMRRYEEMEEAGVNHAKDLPNPPKAILCMIDETTVLLAAEGIKSDEGKERDALHAEAQMIIGELGRLSRASMIHVIMCFQRPDAKYLGGEIKANFDLRIAAGRMDTTPSLMVLDSEAANRLPKVKGRGMIRVGGELETFQGYFAEQAWYDDWVAKQQGGSPTGSEDASAGMLEAPFEDESFEDESFDEADLGGMPMPDANPAPQSPVPPAPPEGEGGKRKRGLRGLAAKAAVKAQERAARLDAEAGLDVSAEGWVDESVAAPGPALTGGPSGYPGGPLPTASPVPPQIPGYPAGMVTGGPVAPAGTPQTQPGLLPTVPPVSPTVPAVPLPATPLAQPVLPVMSDGAGHDLGKDLAPETFDFDALLVDVDEFDDFDEDDLAGDDLAYGAPPTTPAPATAAPPTSVPAPPVPATPPLVQPFRPGAALPPATPPTAPALVQPFRPGAALPTATPPPVLEGEASSPSPQPPGLPVRPSVGLPTQPPEAR